MAKRRPKRQKQQEEKLKRRKDILVRILWVFIIIICLLFGISSGYPIIAEGKIMTGVITGMAYGGGAFIAILLSLYLNRKLRGL